MVMPKLKFVKEESAGPVVAPLLYVRAAVQREAKLDLGQSGGSLAVSLVIPGLSAETVDLLLSLIDQNGLVTLGIMPREGQDGKGTYNGKSG